MKASLLLLPAMLLALATPQPTPDVGCEPCCWFLEQITLEQLPLPPGISLSVLEADGASQAGIRIENHTPELLFVLSLQYQEQLAEPVTPDPQFEARLRYAHEVASYLVPPEGERPLSLGMPTLLDLDPNLQDLNRLDASRPAGEEVEVPAPQRSTLLLVHAEQVLRVPFTITYTLNPDYTPAACGEQGTGTGKPASNATQSPAEKRANDLERGLPGLALLVLVAALWLGANLLARKAGK